MVATQRELACRTGGRRRRRHGDQAGADRAGEPRHRATMRRRELGRAAGCSLAHEQSCSAAPRRAGDRPRAFDPRLATGNRIEAAQLEGDAQRRRGPRRGCVRPSTDAEARRQLLEQRLAQLVAQRAGPALLLEAGQACRRAGGPATAAGRPAPAGGSARATRTAGPRAGDRRLARRRLGRHQAVQPGRRRRRARAGAESEQRRQGERGERDGISASWRALALRHRGVGRLAAQDRFRMLLQVVGEHAQGAGGALQLEQGVLQVAAAPARPDR